jgi:hypothetical protein
MGTTRKTAKNNVENIQSRKGNDAFPRLFMIYHEFLSVIYHQRPPALR